MRIPNPEGQSFQNERAYEEQTALRMVWLVFAGWWISIIWVLVAWLCVVVVPFTRTGLWLLSNITRATSLRSPGEECERILIDTLDRLNEGCVPQRPALLRVLYAIGVGWWASLAWAVLAWIESLSIDRRPTGVARFMRLPRLANLWRY